MEGGRAPRRRWDPSYPWARPLLRSLTQPCEERVNDFVGDRQLFGRKRVAGVVAKVAPTLFLHTQTLFTIIRYKP